MPSSINTNVAAMFATQNLGRTQDELQIYRTRIATGQKVSSAKDNGAIYAIATNERAVSASLNAVRDSLQRSQSITDVSLAAAETISDLLSQMKEKALAAKDAQIGSKSREALNADFTSLRDQITNATKNAKFNGVSLISADAADVSSLTNQAGETGLTVKAQKLTLSGSLVTVTNSSSISSTSSATAALSLVNASIQNVSLALSKLGTGSKALGTHLNFINKLQDAVNAGVGNLVDADMAKESARLQALQTKEQLGYQALAIANQGPGNLLSLFR